MMTKRTHRTAKADGSLFAANKDVQNYPKTGIVYQEFKLFIEGVEVPFISISIGQSYNGLPTANVQIPYFAGLQEITKNYAPKIHIFYKDYVFEKYLISKGVTDYVEGDILRTLFEGIIMTNSYGRAKSSDSGSAFIQFSCVHKYDMLNQVLLKFGGRGSESVDASTPDTVAKSNYMNSRSAVLDALMGIENTSEGHIQEGTGGVNVAVNVRALDPAVKPYYNRLQGIPGISAVLWNTLKRDSYIFKKYARTMTKLYIPLVDDGLRLFRRMSGHPYLERSLETEKISVSTSALASKSLTVDSSAGDPHILVPANYRNFINESVAVEVALSLIETGMQFSGESTSFLGMMMGMWDNMLYGLQVLASPIQSVSKDDDTVNALVKPLLPFYYAPTCNVLLPHMYTSINVSDATNTSPTRVTTQVDIIPAGQDAQTKITPEFRAPHEVRLAEALGGYDVGGSFDLSSTTIRRGEYPAIHELGRGVLLKPIAIKPWIKHLFSSYEMVSKEDTTGGSSGTVAVAPVNYSVLPIPTPLAPASGGSSSTGAAKVIDPKTSPKETRGTAIWKYWDNKANPIPYYYGSATTKGKNIVYGKQGVATVGDTENTKIESFRATTQVPVFWNVVYFPFNDSLYAYPPHYDYIRRQWFAVREIPSKYHKNYTFIIEYAPANAATDKVPATGVPYKEPVPVTTVLLTNPLANLETFITQLNPVPVSTAVTPAATWEDPTLEALRVAWNTDHPNQETLNPYSPTTVNKSAPYAITLINTLDYEYALSLVEARQGSVDGMFNPFIIPGYPMDIIDPSPERPSFHAFCVSVTHTITPRMASTSISFSSCLTYDELRNYELPALLPWYRKQLYFVDKLSLVHQTDKAKEAANKFYLEVLGCGYADPTLLEDERTNSSNFVKVNAKGDFEVTKTGANIAKENSVQSMVLGFTDQNLSYEGNLALIRREIETLSDVEHFSDITFIAIPPSSDKGFEYAEREVKVSALRSDYIRKPGRSLFLDYESEDTALAREVAAKSAKKE